MIVIGADTHKRNHALAAVDGGIGVVLCAIGLVDTAAPLPEEMPAGKVGRSPVGRGAVCAMRDAFDGTTLVAGCTREGARVVCAFTAEAAARAQITAAARRVEASMATPVDRAAVRARTA